MRPYSTDVRIRLVQAYENHEGSLRQLAARFRFSLSCVRDLLTRYRRTGDVTPQPHGGGYPAQIDATSTTRRKYVSSSFHRIAWKTTRSPAPNWRGMCGTQY